jgi:hypothetical protein
MPMDDSQSPTPPKAVGHIFPPHWSARLKAALRAGIETPEGPLALVLPSDGSDVEPPLDGAYEAGEVLWQMIQLGRAIRRSPDAPKTAAGVLFALYMIDAL